jgi:hypothetical protein
LVALPGSTMSPEPDVEPATSVSLPVAASTIHTRGCAVNSMSPAELTIRPYGANRTSLISAPGAGPTAANPLLIGVNVDPEVSHL